MKVFKRDFPSRGFHSSAFLVWKAREGFAAAIFFYEQVSDYLGICRYKKQLYGSMISKDARLQNTKYPRFDISVKASLKL